MGNGRPDRTGAGGCRVWPIRQLLLVGYPVVIVATVLAIAIVGYGVARHAVERETRATMAAAVALVGERLNALFDAGERATFVAARLLETRDIAWHDADAVERHLLALLREVEGIDGAFFGTSEGAYVYVTRDADGGVGFVSKLIEASDGLRSARLRERDAGFRLIAEMADPTDVFDPRIRPWYRQALDDGRTGWTAPYVFYLSGRPGMSFARRATCHAELTCVVGVSLSFAGLAQFLDHVAVETTGRAFLATEDGRLLAGAGRVPLAGFDPYSRPELRPVDRVAEPLAAATLDSLSGTREPNPRLGEFRHQGQSYLASALVVRRAGYPMLVACWVPWSDLFGWFESFGARLLAAAATILLIALAFATMVSRWLAAELDRVREAVVAIPSGRPADPALPASRLREVRVIEEAAHRAAVARRTSEAAVADALHTATAAGRAKSDFLAHMSHELRTPLNAIEGFLELFRMRAADRLAARERGYVDDMASAARRLSHVIGSILELAAGEGRRLPLDESRVALDTLVRAVAEAQNGPARERGLTLAVRCAAGLVVHADQARLQRALDHLVRNAIAHTPAGGHVEITVDRAPDGLVIAVRDTGCGMSQEEVQRVLTPFGRRPVDPYVATPGGFGFGLPTVRAFAEMHGGRLALSSIPDGGTTAILHLPIDRMARPDAALPPSGA